MKVLHLCTMITSGGAARSTINLHLALRRLGVESTILSLSGSDAVPHSVKCANWEERTAALGDLNYFLVFTNRTPVSNSYFSIDLFGYDLTQHPLVQEADVINLSWIAEFLSSVSIAELSALGKPLVWTLHDMRPLTGGCHFSGGCNRFEEACGQCPQLKEDLITAENLRAMRSALAMAKPILIAPSQWMLENARRSTVSRDLESYCVPNAVNPDIFKPLEKETCRSELNLEQEVWYILFTAHSLQEFRKGAGHALAILEGLKENPTTAEAVAAGKIQVLSCGESGSNFMPAGWKIQHVDSMPLEKMALFYNSGDILLFASLEDNLPNVVLEAMACGVPVVSHRVGGTVDLLEDIGCLVEIGDTQAAVRAIVDLFQNSQRYQEMSLGSVEKAKRDFSLEKQANAYLEVYQKAIAQPPEKALRSLREGSSNAIFSALEACKNNRKLIQINEQLRKIGEDLVQENNRLCNLLDQMKNSN